MKKEVTYEEIQLIVTPIGFELSFRIMSTRNIKVEIILYRTQSQIETAV